MDSISLPLWPEGASQLSNVREEDRPSLTVHFPSVMTNPVAAAVICPGGGYGALMMSYEGHDIARWLNRLGLVGAVLKYRISPYRHPAPMSDGCRAVRLLKVKAEEWKLDARRIGIVGFSAGGHLASTVGTHFDAGNPTADDTVERQSCRPNFMVLIYPVISMLEKTHPGSRDNLLGKHPRAEDLELLSNEKHVSPQTPPTFLAHAKTDPAVAVENSAFFYEALKKHGVPAEFFELPEGGHGLGAGRGRLWAAWQTRCAQWLKKQGLTTE